MCRDMVQKIILGKATEKGRVLSSTMDFEKDLPTTG